MTQLAYPKLGEWPRINAASTRVDDLMRGDWRLIDQAADLLDAGDYNPEVCDTLRDIWTESLAIEEKLAMTRIGRKRWVPNAYPIH